MILQEAPSASTPTAQDRIPAGSRTGAHAESKHAHDSDPQAGARALGWFSIALGTVELLFPRRLARAAGMPPKPILMRLMGLREIGVGAGILASERKAGWLRARVAGDVIDLAMLKSSFDSRRSRRVRLSGATAGVAAITAADIFYARKLSAVEPGTGHIRVEASMAVNKPAAECYEFWRDVTNFPKFMKNVETTRVSDGRTHWKVRAGLTNLEWDADITEDVPSETISWQSVNCAELPNSGSVRFEPRLGARGANVRLAMEYEAPAAGLGGAADGFLKTISQHQVRENLRRFKSVMECGEFPVTEGQPSGRQMCAAKKEAVQ